MMKRWVAVLFAVTSCLWWLGVTLFFIIKNEPGPFAPMRLAEWNQMEIVHQLAPWIAVPFMVVGGWLITARVFNRAAQHPVWLTWTYGAAALLWIGVATGRAHEQVVNCVLWAPPPMYGGPDCSLPLLMLARLEWFAVPIVAWLVLAALRSPPSALMRSTT